MKKYILLSLFLFLTGCQSTQVFIAERADKDEFDYELGKFHFGPSPGDGFPPKELSK